MTVGSNTKEIALHVTALLCMVLAFVLMTVGAHALDGAAPQSESMLAPMLSLILVFLAVATEIGALCLRRRRL